MNRIALLGFVFAIAACSAKSALPPNEEDVLYLTNDEVLRGRIVGQSGAGYLLEQDGRVRQVSAGSVYSVDYSPATYASLTTPPPQPVQSPASTNAPTSWCPRLSVQERIDIFEIDWQKRHDFEHCVGILAEGARKNPDCLFVPAGGKVIFHDPKRWGWHAHSWPGEPDRYLAPTGESQLVVRIPEKGDLAEAVAFVSASREAKTVDGPDRSSYVIPDSAYFKLLPIGQSEGMLSVQPFAGGKPQRTANGTLWAFALPRNENQFLVYLLDPERNHGPHLKSAFIGYREVLLAADFMVDVEAPDGETLGRVLCVPYPDTGSAEGGAREPVTVFAGSEKDPTAVASVPLPPRPILQLPPRRPATRADVLVANYEVSPSVPEVLTIAHGRGRPNAEVTLVQRPLTAERADEIVKIDLSSLGTEGFPAVVWFSARRRYVWRETGGHLAPVPVWQVAPAAARPTLVKRNEGIPHVTPILFTGPRSEARAVGSAPSVSLSSGLSDALLADNQFRESGGLPAAPAGPTTPGGPAADGQPITNTTYVNITVPPHTSGGMGDVGSGSTRPSVGGLQLVTYPGWQSRNPIGSYSVVNSTTGQMFDPYGNPIIRTPSTGGQNPQQSGFGVDQGGMPIINFRRRR